MEENDLILDDNAPQGKGERPMFLTVLCILTWVGSGWAFLSSTFSMFTLNTMSSAFNKSGADFNEIADRMNDLPETGEPGEEFGRAMANEVFGSMDDIIKWAPTLNLVNMGVALLCILGAFMMWKLKKTGFYIYTAATLVAIIVPLVLLGGNLIGALSAVGAGFFGIAFVIMYGVNLKHMR